ncbi:hypothetical protein GO755_40290 [Spirosoma sp. HMF4905]|uniref:Uncharacterized protein n=1 Tax=Spirosoma arboris TaxID=2682092 RepID=A0A7K1SRI1_9BACT|nr:hypothetical protein [Spirosoma arboris]MVM36313.1 hypothetical protein [Spirosoma arboris]
MVDTTLLQRGHLVELIHSGEQAIVCRAYETFVQLPQALSGQPVASYEEWLAQEEPELLSAWDKALPWYHCMELGAGWKPLTTCQSNLVEIQPTQINRQRYPFTYYAELVTVDPIDEGALRLVFKAQSAGWLGTPSINSISVFIEQPTVTPCVGDTIYGNYDYSVVSSGGILFPYQRFGHLLIQDWPIAQ